MREQPDDATVKPDEPPAVRYAARPASRRTRWFGLTLCVVGMLFVALLVQSAVTSSLGGRIDPSWIQCHNRLRAIGCALKCYALDNADAYPPTLQILIDYGYADPSCFVSPMSRQTERACDYHYVSGLTDKHPPHWIVAHTDPAYAPGKGTGANILHLDGHVDFVKEPQFSQDLARFKADYEKARGTPPVIIPPH